MSNDDVFIYFHIPKSGGTTLVWSIGHYHHREDDRWLRHYHWMNTQDYIYNNIPLLEKRTTEQQKQLKFFTGHSTYNMVHYWLKVRKNPKFFSTVRDPIDRLLSSFNYRYGISSLNQDNQLFSNLNPSMDRHARFNLKTAYDYNTLYEFYQDVKAEQNLQCKWFLKSFYSLIDNNFHPHEELLKFSDGNNPDIWPEWFEYVDIDEVLYNKVLELVDTKMWWIGTNNTLSQDIKDLCKHAQVPYVAVDNRHRSGIDFPRYWSREDVENQPDYEKLLNSEKWDMHLYNYVNKNLKRPF